jgi:ankyrin repeat protein
MCVHLKYKLHFYVIKTQSGMTPVYFASEKGHTDVVNVLVQAGADIHLATKVL